MTNNIKIGRLGEDICANFLIGKGWRIIARNYRRKADEIDLIAITPDKTLVFIEVKTLILHESYYRDTLAPEDNFTAAKLKKISRVCEFFARQNPGMINEEKGWRIDLIAIDINRFGVPSSVRHFENV